MSSPTTPPRDAWAQLRQLTPARVALGRVGTSLPTAAHLDFQLAHAQARDAVHLAFDPQPLQAALQQRGRNSILLHSAAVDRHTYLQRPDLGRRLGEDAAAHLRGLTAVHGGGHDVAVVVADGLSALAVHRHAAQMLEHIDALAAHEGWSLAPVALIAQGRVAIGDEVGDLLKARLVIVLIGERPGLSSPDSLGLYLTYTARRPHRRRAQLHLQYPRRRTELRRSHAQACVPAARIVPAQAIRRATQGRSRATGAAVGGRVRCRAADILTSRWDAAGLLNLVRSKPT